MGSVGIATGSAVNGRNVWAAAINTWSATIGSGKNLGAYPQVFPVPPQDVCQQSIVTPC